VEGGVEMDERLVFGFGPEAYVRSPRLLFGSDIDKSASDIGRALFSLLAWSTVANA
jgi:hypothetical protein